QATKAEEISTLITFPGEEPDFDDDLGEFGNPEWRGRAIANVDIGESFGVFWSTQYIGEQEDIIPPGTTTADGVATIAAVDEYFVSDASLRYSADDWAVTVGVRNIFDQEPPLVDQDTTAAVSARNVPLGLGYDQIGRRVFISASKAF
ncbi:MAG: hypothetical protein AAGF20_06410, partial [Pseudomonadota bacterium]